MQWKNKVLTAVVGAFVTLAAPAALAQGYPAKPVRLVINFAAGGTTDVVGRAIAKSLTSELGQPVLVDNKTGALGAIGASEVARAAPDGYTVLLTTQGSLTEIPVLNPNTPYNPSTAFAPITQVGTSPFVLFAHPSFPANNLKELVAYSRTRPDGIDISLSGSSVTLGAFALADAGNIKFVRVPYAGAAPALTAALGGHTKLGLNAVTTTMMQQVQSGKLKLLAVGSDGPYKLLPGVPSFTETFPGVTSDCWWGMFAPAGTPAPVVQRLNQAIRKVLTDPDVIKVMHANAMVPAPTSPAELNALVEKGLANTKAISAKHTITLN